MTDNLDLETAKRLAIQAGFPELAQAFQYQSEGLVNAFQGTLGQSFLASVERIGAANRETIAALLDEKLSPVASQNTETNKLLGELRQGLSLVQEGFQSIGERVTTIEGDVETHDARLDNHDARLDTQEARLTAVEGRTEALEGRVDVLEAIAKETGATLTQSQLLQQLHKKRGV